MTKKTKKLLTTAVKFIEDFRSYKIHLKNKVVSLRDIIYLRIHLQPFPK